jgi:hypothetical protein
VFSRSQDGYHTFRIPAVLKAADGTLLAFAEGRVNSPSDDGNIDLVLTRSTDGGFTWGPLQVLVDDGRIGSPIPCRPPNGANRPQRDSSVWSRLDHRVRFSRAVG